MKNRLIRLALLLTPTLLLAIWAVQLTVQRNSLPSMRVAIQGYDPRDLLRGHFLSFRLVLPGPTKAMSADNACFCLEPNPADALRPTIRPGQCAPASGQASCPHLLSNPWQSYRYYAAKDRAQELERELRASPGAASVLVHFHGDGAASFSDIVTGNK